MVSEKKLLQEMDEILALLIEIANKLNAACQQTPSKEVIVPLQVKQSELIDRLEELDQNYRELKKDAKREKKYEDLILKKLDQFQVLNDTFIRKYSKYSGLIQFEPKK